MYWEVLFWDAVCGFGRQVGGREFSEEGERASRGRGPEMLRWEVDIVIAEGTCRWGVVVLALISGASAPGGVVEKGEDSLAVSVSSVAENGSGAS